MGFEPQIQKLIIWSLGFVAMTGGTIFVGLFVWAVKSVVGTFVNLIKSQDRINTKLQEISESLKVIPELQKDVTHLHAKFRSLQNGKDTTD